MREASHGYVRIMTECLDEKTLEMVSGLEESLPAVYRIFVKSGDRTLREVLRSARKREGGEREVFLRAVSEVAYGAGDRAVRKVAKRLEGYDSVPPELWVGLKDIAYKWKDVMEDVAGAISVQEEQIAKAFVRQLSREITGDRAESYARIFSNRAIARNLRGYGEDPAIAEAIVGVLLSKYPDTMGIYESARFFRRKEIRGLISKFRGDAEAAEKAARLVYDILLSDGRKEASRVAEAVSAYDRDTAKEILARLSTYRFRRALDIYGTGKNMFARFLNLVSDPDFREQIERGEADIRTLEGICRNDGLYRAVALVGNYRS